MAQGFKSMTYETALNHAVGRSIAARYHNFEEVARSAEGAFPADVEQAARRLGVSLCVTKPVAYSLPVYRADWPEPHPANYEWRFAEESASAIADLVGRCKSVACLGCPTVFHHLKLRGLNPTLIDRNHYILKSLRITWPDADIRELDLRFPFANDLQGRFEAIIADPPWYPQHILSWASRGVELAMSPDASIFVSIFPRLTRPNAGEEIGKMIGLFRRLGSVKFLSLRPIYETPQFEAESLIASGVPSTSNWRRGHWIKIHIQRRLRVGVSFPHEPSWKLFRFGSEVIAIRNNLPAGPTQILPLGSDGILRTTSARDPLRKQIDIWTSRNRIFRAIGGVGIFSLFSEAEQLLGDSHLQYADSMGDFLIREGLAGLRRMVCLQS